jgi:lipoprotein-releasing system permease protein
VIQNQISSYVTEGSVSEIEQGGILGIVLSESVAKELSLAVGDTFFSLFASNNLMLPKQRKSKLLATFRTDFPEFDQSIAWTNFESLRKLSAFENPTEYRVYFRSETDRHTVINDLKISLSDRYEVVEVAELYPELFHWLSLFDLNRLIILIVVMGVAFFTLITTLISQIIERRISLALLISMGADPSSLRLIFTRIGGYYLQVGLFWGCFSALLLTSIQNRFGWLTFPNPEEYYSSEIIFSITFTDWLVYSFSFLVAGYLVIFVTSFAIVKIKATSLLRI